MLSGGFNRLTSVENGAQERKFVGGSQQISNELAKSLGQGHVLLNNPVSFVNWADEKRQSCIVTTRDGQQHEADFVIVALAPPLYPSLGFSPALPVAKRQLAMRMPMGCIIKTIVQYKAPFWRAKGFNGTIFSDQGPVTYSYDDANSTNTEFGLMGFVLAANARRWGYVTPEERKMAICQQYAKAFQADEALNPIGYKEMNWNEEEFSGLLWGTPLGWAGG